MTARLYPVDAVTGAPSYTGRALRQTLAPLVPGATTARPLGAQSGVRPGTPSTTASVAGLTWTVTPHAGVLDVETSAVAGPYAYAFDANSTGSVNAAHATYARWDGIYVQLSDPAESDGTSVPGVAIVYVAGTAAASPAMPTTPARSMLLARLVVPASGGGATSVVWLAPIIVADPSSFASMADLTLRHPTPVAGQFAYTSDYGVLWRWNGTTWRPIGAVVADTAARDAAITAPLAGDECRVGAAAVWSSYRHNGTTWVLQSRTKTAWTPTITGVTAGLSVNSAYYWVIDGSIYGSIRLDCSGALSGSDLYLSMPSGLTIADLPFNWPVGDVLINPNGTEVFGKVVCGAVGGALIRILASTSGAKVAIGATVPATWGARACAVFGTFHAPLA